MTSSDASSSPLRVYPLNRNWLFSPDVPQGAIDKEFDDSSFERVTIPHTNTRLPWHSFDDRDYQFVSVYRRHFAVPAGAEGKRLLLDFEGVMTSSTVYVNGRLLGEYKGGYTPFSFEITDVVDRAGENVVAVVVDSTERADIPPFGGRIDYLTFGGIYREVSLRVVPKTFIQNVFAKPVNVLGGDRRLDVRCFLDGEWQPGPATVEVEVRDGQNGGTVIASARREFSLGQLGFPPDTLSSPTVIPSAAKNPSSTIRVLDLQIPLPDAIELWDIDHPKLYDVVVRLTAAEESTDEYLTRIGFREARFTPNGFMLNGRRVKLRGLNRHQTFPYVGQAMPARVQRRDALILKHELKCNVVRTSHYPQSIHFLDACDEIGLLVFEEIPGWQHIGDQAWKDIACQNVAEMIRRDWNHPSIILWGVRINESKDDHDFYLRTNRIAHELDDSRQTGGVRNFYASERLEDVFTMNDFNPNELMEPNHPLYLNTEFCGHMFPTKHIDNVERVQEHVRRHAHIHSILGSDDQYAGGIGWCAFDYNTHGDFGSGDRICYHGVSDIFRMPKPAADFYRSQCDPAEEMVLAPAFHWAIGDRSGGGGPGTGFISSNCDHLKIYVGDVLTAEVDPDRERYGHLPHPPFVCERLRGLWGQKWHDLRIEGYVNGEKVITHRMSAAGVDREFHLEADDGSLIGDGIDATRVAFRVTDEYGNPRPFATGAIQLTLQGPGEIIGENPFALTGGVGAVWVRTAEAGGIIRLSARHPFLGEKAVEIAVSAAQPEAC